MHKPMLPALPRCDPTGIGENSASTRAALTSEDIFRSDTLSVYRNGSFKLKVAGAGAEQSSQALKMKMFDNFLPSQAMTALGFFRTLLLLEGWKILVLYNRTSSSSLP